MHGLYAFGILVLIAFLGSRFVFKKKKALTPLNYFFSSGLIYILVGLYLGKYGFNVLSSQVLEGLNPLVSLGLGWIGFLFGFQLEVKYLRKFSWKYLTLSLLQALFAFFFVFVAVFLTLNLLYGSISLFLLYGMAVALGLFATLNSPSLLNASSSVVASKGEYYYLARFLVSVSSFWGLIGLALLFSFWHFPFFEIKAFKSGMLVLIASTVFPFLLGYLFHLLTRRKASEQDLLVYLLGLVFFSSGAAFYFNLSPLYTSMVMGITYSNLTRIHERLYPLLFSTEKPLYITFLILIGALWEVALDLKVIVLVVFLLLARVMSNGLPLPSFRGILRFPFPLPPLFGFCFLSSGGIGVAFAVSLKLAYPLAVTDVFLSVALLAIIVSEVLSPLALKISLFRLDSEDKS